MPTWILLAFASMAFAGFTSVIAKRGLVGISGDLGLTIRTLFVAAFVVPFALVVVPRAELQVLSRRNVAWLAASAMTTTLSWICYYRAIKAGDVGTVALIDKGSVLLVLPLAWLLLGERPSAGQLAGAVLIVAGLVLVARR